MWFGPHEDQHWVYNLFGLQGAKSQQQRAQEVESQVNPKCYQAAARASNSLSKQTLNVASHWAANGHLLVLVVAAVAILNLESALEIISTRSTA